MPVTRPREPLLTRRRLLRVAATGAVCAVGARLILPQLWRTGPVREADEETVAFVRRCLDGLQRGQVVDTHVHLAGTETDVTGCWLNPAMQSWARPGQRLRYELFMGAAGVDRDAGGDAQYVERLLERHRAGNPTGRLLVLAFERFHDERGEPDLRRSVMHVPDAYVLDLARRHPEILACVSIHPYRGDAVDRLEAAVAQGARAVKWLPSAMHIDPLSALCRPFLRALARLRVPLVTHAGEESALTLADLEPLNNPLRLRAALDEGVTVIVAHAGSLGEVDDLDAGSGTLPAFDAFLRLFLDRRYERNLLADLSAVPFANRGGDVLRRLLLMGDEQHRLVNGSDYPVSAVPPVTSTALLQWHGFLDGEDRRLLAKVFDANPLLYDLCLKRCLRAIDAGREWRFSPTVFESAWLFERPA